MLKTTDGGLKMRQMASSRHISYIPFFSWHGWNLWNTVPMMRQIFLTIIPRLLQIALWYIVKYLGDSLCVTAWFVSNQKNQTKNTKKSLSYSTYNINSLGLFRSLLDTEQISWSLNMSGSRGKQFPDFRSPEVGNICYSYSGMMKHCLSKQLPMVKRSFVLVNTILLLLLEINSITKVMW